jgi:hypothetical protein
MTAAAGAVAAYPMVEETEATGRVAAVYADLLAGGMPFVPSVFKSLALCPAYLELAHDQAAGVLDEPAFADAAHELVSTVQSASLPPPDRDARQVLADFVQPLARMLLLTAGLREALDGRLHAPPARARTHRNGPEQLPQPTPSTTEAGEPALFGEIRATLRTPIVNTIWRSLATSGQLGAAWRALGPQVAGTRPAAAGLQRHALAIAGRLPWKTVASAESLAACEAGDAAPGMRAVLTTYLLTLPRVLALAASSAAD